MVNMGRRKEIGKSSDNLFNGIWRDYKGINMRAVIKMGYFLTLMGAPMNYSHLPNTYCV
jgi:hypothetical protein